MVECTFQIHQMLLCFRTAHAVFAADNIGQARLKLNAYKYEHCHGCVGPTTTGFKEYAYQKFVT